MGISGLDALTGAGQLSNLRLLITGSRTWDDAETIERSLSNFAAYTTLVSGACPTGADALCEAYATRRGWDVELYPVSRLDYKAFGNRAYYLRNQKMVDSGADICVAFIKDFSKGAEMTVKLAEEAGIRTVIYRNET